MKKHHRTKFIHCTVALFLAAMFAGASGCAVPQKPGKGRCTREVEPETQTGYWLYLPEDYVKNNGQHSDKQLWPVVVTFHGLKPYDNANPQIREWQEEADRYGFIAIAPELRTCDSLTMQFPLRDTSLPYVQKDAKAFLAIMDEVCRRTNADPHRVLATSFSSGGYMAHYLVNRFPERFSCIAVRGSNFNEQMLNPSQVPKYRSMEVGIFFGENDFKVCQDESMDAIDWYRRRHFKVTAKKVSGLGHERRPQTAAAFFASTIGATPKTPPQLGSLVMQDVYPAGDIRPVQRRRSIYRPPPIPPSPRSEPTGAWARRQPPSRNLVFNSSGSSSLSPTRSAHASAAGNTSRKPSVQTGSTANTASGNAPAQVAPTKTTKRAPAPVRYTPRRSQTPKRRIRQPYSTTPTPAPRSLERKTNVTPPLREQSRTTYIPARIRVHGETVGRAPMWITLSVEMPDTLRQGASVLWTDNMTPIGSNAFQTQGLLRDAGDHRIRARIITADDRKIILEETIKVLNPTSQPAES